MEAVEKRVQGGGEAERYTESLILRLQQVAFRVTRLPTVDGIQGCPICFSYHVFVLVYFFPEVIFHSRVIGACPSTTDSILVMS